VKLDPAGFTPGPWKLDDTSAHYGHAHLIHGFYHFIDAGCGYCIDGNPDPGFSLSALMSIADARLIAAAPDLVSALQEALEFVDAYVDVIDGDGELRPNRAMSLDQEIRQALGKAGVR
jgi:hypothetical protein